MNMRFIDLHCDTMTRKGGTPLAEWTGHVTPEKLRRGGALAQCFALYILTREPALRRPDDLPPHAVFDRYYESYCQELNIHASLIAPARSVSEIAGNARRGLISSILTVEDAVALEGRLSTLDEWYAKGVRMATLLWNYENELGFPHSRDPEQMGRGLKAFGKDVVRRMNELGMIIDVSHLSDGGVRDVARLSRQPFVASHSCARALCDHSRCLSDELLRLIAERGGVIGLNFFGIFLREGSEVTLIEDIVRHALHIRDKAGMEALAFGSDFDGISSRLEFGDYAGMPRLAAALEKHFTPREMEKFCSGNALRVMREVWGK